MAQIGNVQTVLICIPGDGVQGVCPAGQTQSVTQAYLVASSEGAKLDLMAEPFDSSVAGAYFGAAFALTISIWALAYGAGTIVSFIKKS